MQALPSPSRAGAAGPEPTAPAGVLESLLGGRPASTLAEAGWPRRHLAVRAGRHPLPPLLQRLREQPAAAVFDQYAGPVSFGRGRVSVVTADSHVHPAHLLAMGLTVHLSDLSPGEPEAGPLLAALERELQLPPGTARLTVFASPRGDGLPAHFDGEDVISVQLHGRKRFRLAPVEGLAFALGPQFGPGQQPGEALYPQCGQGFPTAPGADAQTVELAPGDVLFLPRGTWHETEALEDSVSVSIVLRAPALLDALLQQLRLVLLQDERWRIPVYGLAASAAPTDASSALAASRDALLAALPALLRELGGAALLPMGSERASARYQAVPGARLALSDDAPDPVLTVFAPDAEWIARRTLARPVGITLAPALRWLAQRRAAFDDATLAAAVPALPATSLAPLLEGLAQAGYLRRLAFPALPG